MATENPPKAQSSPAPTPVLNWRELSVLVEHFSSLLLGPIPGGARAVPEVMQNRVKKGSNESLFVERISVPSRPRFPGGFLKNEWAIRLTSRTAELTLDFSVRVRTPFLTLAEGKGPKPAGKATHSVFDLAISKYLRGARLLDLMALPRERIAIFWFSAPGNSGSENSTPPGRFGLVLCLIPAMPEALLIQDFAQSLQDNWPILARTRVPGKSKQKDPADAIFKIPDSSKAPASPEVRSELVSSALSHATAIEQALVGEAFELRLAKVRRSLSDALKQATTRIRQSQTSNSEAECEPDWRRMADLFKAQMADLPEPAQDGKKWFRELTDPESGEKLRAPCDPQLGPHAPASAQLQRLYWLAKRKSRRAEESKQRSEAFQEVQAKIRGCLETPIEFIDWKALESLERTAIGMGANSSSAPSSAFASSSVSSSVSSSASSGAEHSGKQAAGGSANAANKDKRDKKAGLWLGKVFHSRDGSTIWIGRNKDENLELTFRRARGNDVWMHVRGKPGAHAVIPVQSGKSVSLETLLDAAALTVYYSGGENWGKTEVDYTFKKFVKRIRDSSEAGYTNNKTLIVEPDPDRMKRLIASGMSVS